ALTVIASLWLGQASAQTNVFNDFPSFDAATGSLTEIDFETLSYTFESSTPLTLNNVTFTDPATLRVGFCSSPTCQPDSDNPSDGNIVLFLNVGATIDLPART